MSFDLFINFIGYPKVLLLGLFAGYFWKGYIKKKASNTADIEDMSKITGITELTRLGWKKELEVYYAIWPKLVTLNSATYALRPVFESVDPTKSNDERRKEKFEFFNKAMNELKAEFIYNKPFYPENIFNEIEQVVRTAYSEAVDFEYLDRSRDAWKQSQENINKINLHVDRVSALIKERTAFLEMEDKKP